MSDVGSPAVRQRRLAGELRRLRRRARLTGRDVATHFGWSEAKLSRIENGQTRVKAEDLGELMDLYDVSGPHRAGLIALAEESRETGLLEEISGDLPEGHTEILRAESEAQAMSIWEPQIVPGLLQREDYTRALLKLWPGIFAMPAGAIERRVETSRVRQRVLTRTPALELSVVIDESVLIRGFAPPSVMRDQLNHLAQISEQPSLELRILPLGGDQVIGTGAFVYFRFPRIHGVSAPDAVALEHLHGTTFVDDEAEVNQYRLVFRALCDTSLSAQASRDTLARVARESW